MKNKQILLPTDFSNNARKAIDYAIYLLEKVDCTFHILHSFEVDASGLGRTMGKAKDTRLYRAVKEASERDVKAMVKELETKNKNPLHTFKGLSIADTLVNAIGRTTIDKDIHYIFMGTKGSSAVKEVFMGSSTIKVLQHIDFCPIVAVPGNYDFDLPDQIAFATNFEHTYSKVELVPLMEMAKLWDSEIAIVHIDNGKISSTEQQTNKDLLAKRLKGLKYNFVEIVGHPKISEAIMSYTAKNENIGMVAMINYWHGFFAKLTKENVIKQVAFHTEIPFLIFPRID
jgi:nucleotide-binding universal stress UspA family protein